jgi:hypothetical protein
MARSKKNQVTREMYIKTRRAFREIADKTSPVVCVQIDFTSVKTDNGEVSISNHTVTLWVDGRASDTCSCQGFSTHKHCCHVDHFRLVEMLRVGMTIAATAPAADNKEQAIEALVASINAKAGETVIGYATTAKAAEAASDAVLEKTTSTLVGNRYRADIPPRRSGPSPIVVDPSWLLRSA